MTTLHIIDTVSRHYRIEPSVFVNGPSTADLVTPRRVAWFLIRYRDVAGPSELGRLFNRNHATIIHGVNHVALRMEQDDHFNALIEELNKKI